MKGVVWYSLSKISHQVCININRDMSSEVTPLELTNGIRK